MKTDADVILETDKEGGPKISYLQFQFNNMVDCVSIFLTFLIQEMLKSKQKRKSRWGEVRLETKIGPSESVCVLCCVQFFVTPWTVARQAPLSMEFSRQEYCSRLTFPIPEDLSYSGI